MTLIIFPKMISSFLLMANDVGKISKASIFDKLTAGHIANLN